ncbi:hypothetical protein WN48_02925 [Eufriesea mexicana]|nr:hypothetical protein WN48_02925 [Eufriesea mexicana]
MAFGLENGHGKWSMELSSENREHTLHWQLKEHGKRKETKKACRKTSVHLK